MRVAPAIREELDSHLAELIEDFVADGFAPDAAEHEARRVFGNPTQLADAVAAIDGRRRFGTSFRLSIVRFYAFIALLLGIVFVSGHPHINGTIVEPLALTWLSVGVILLVTRVLHWVVEYTGYDTARPMLVGTAFSALVGMSITILFDVDKFLVPLYILALGILSAALGTAFWDRMSVMVRRVLVYGYGSIATWAALNAGLVLNLLGVQRCVYLTPDVLPIPQDLAQCTQIPWQSSALYPFYAMLAIGLPYLGVFLFRYWQSHASFTYRKALLTLAVAAIPAVPSMTHDINNLGQLDVVRWKPAIFESYQDILGRDPQDKDIEFYAMTRAYRDLPRVRAVLYASHERQLKINLLYEESLGRPATEQELQSAVAAHRTVEQIRRDLQP
ncbi:MAG: hypothetical protein HY341_01345 [Candidatus Kerfeldbacteria bacterium]|nr:hypothetical protein [Candidatus Kerfeldbacteria bacterium]